MPVQPIIVAIDPYRPDSGATALGSLLSRVTGSPLLLASAYPINPRLDYGQPEIAETLRDEALAGVETARKAVAVQPGRARATVVAAETSTADAIAGLAVREGAALIVLGPSSRGAVGRTLPGAVTDRLLHRAPCPVAVAPVGYAADELRLIGVGFVDRPDGRAALACANDIAERAAGLVRVLTVREPVDWRLAAPLAAAQQAALERFRDEEVERTARIGLEAVPEHRSGGSEILAGRPRDALTAASADLDLLVCGSRGYGPVGTLLHGGVSHPLVRGATCPVVVVPLAPAEEVAA